MKKILKLLCCAILLLPLCVTEVNAQSSPVSSGGEAVGSGGTASYSLGEVVYTGHTSVGGYVIEGVQQAYTSVELPISLLEFNASATSSKQIALSWITVSETSNQYFTIERSVDGVSFSDVIEVDSKGNNLGSQNYNATDESPYNGISYYRLKQTDIDGKSTYSKSIKVNVAASEGELLAYPNPTTTLLNLSIKDAANKKLVYIIYTVDGKRIDEQQINSDFTAIPTSKFINGIYLLQVKQNGTTIKTFRVIKN